MIKLVRFYIQHSNICDEVWRIKKEPEETLFEIIVKDSPEYVDKDVILHIAGDVLAFLNEKYIDKEINAEWGKVDVDKRIKYYEKQIELLKSGKYCWNNNGDGVSSL